MMNLNSKELSESLIFPILSKLNIKRYDSGLKHGYYETAGMPSCKLHKSKYFCLAMVPL